MIFSANKIKQAVESGEIFIEPFDEKFLKPGSYTFTLGDKFRKMKSKDFVDSRINELEFDEFEMGAGGYLLNPGEFIICHTAEKLKLGKDIGCFLTMRGARAQSGLDVLQCEIFCEPGSGGGWDGKLMLETSNRSSYPVKLFPGIVIIKAVFIKVTL